MDQDRRILRTQQENFQKKVVQVWKITIFHLQTALFNGASMGAITGSPTELARPDGVATFTRFHGASTRYYALFRLLRASAVQKV
jgi:hypothetical protein